MITTLKHKTIVDAEGVNCRLVRELQPFVGSDVPSDQQVRLGLVLDTEATGTDRNKAKLLEFAAIPFFFNSEGVISKAMPVIEMLNDPGERIEPEVSKVTGITDEMVSGQYADPGVIDNILGRATIVVAHNAEYDFGVLRGHGVTKRPNWLCSWRDVPWRDFGLSMGTLDYLAYKFGFYFDAHRGKSDCAALLQILSSELPDGATVLRHAFSGMARVYRVKANDSPFSAKDKLKARGYRWDGDGKVWYRDVKSDLLSEEKDWLVRDVYDGHDKSTEKVFDATNRFE